jgi:hypothetical protein
MSPRALRVIAGAIIGVLVAPGAILLAIVSGGAGHGHYVSARLLFPYTMLLTLLMHDTITPLLAALALGQFPLCGALIGCAASKTQAMIVIGLLLILHMGAVALCFMGLIPNFS